MPRTGILPLSARGPASLHVLIVEDEARTSSELRVGLEAAGLEVRQASSGEEGLRLCAEEAFEAMVVDVMLPGISGLTLVRRLREAGNDTPVIFLSAKGDLVDRLHGLEAGGDDYLAKPYSILEVVARLRTIARRVQGRQQTGRMQVADLVWDAGHRQISRSGHRIDLTPKEYALMTLLLEHAGHVVPRGQMVQAIWGMDCAVDPNAVDVQILRLRRKVDGPYPVKLIHTLRGVGLLLEPRETA
ncbi:DNA-binding response regulator [Geothrix oryzae]|uniref:DNA-binding response regulator n=1 Tax=Geothrix oryzae TaxID=2927975 RepID=A0ABM8DSF5_9BACT|nr:response regulator transcription factor [Geothrix oryzae]BDU69947.1 DNA-binding response regulator [Geothrix oryzae]